MSHASLRWLRVAAIAAIAAGCGHPSRTEPGAPRPPHAESDGVVLLSPLPVEPSEAHALARIVGDARVVLLGESSHGAGNAFSWRAAVVEILHRDLGFQHLVMESSFYDCRRAFLESRVHRDPVRLGRQCAFDIWSEAVEAEPLWQQVVDSASGPRPLQLWGMDPQLSGDVDEWLLTDLSRLAAELVPAHDPAVLRATLAAIRDDDIARTPPEREAGRDLLDRLRRAFARQPESWQPPTETRLFWQHALDSLVATEEDYYLYQLAGRKIDPTQHNLRERQMAANLLHLIRRRPRERFVVWLHNGHAAKNLDEIGVVDHGDHSHDFRESVMLGGLIADALEPDPLIVAMVSTEGRWAIANKPAEGAVPVQPRGGLGDRLAAAGIDRALLDLRVAPRRFPWLAAPLSAPILGMEPSTAVWPRHVDVLLFERRMTPATTRPP